MPDHAARYRDQMQRHRLVPRPANAWDQRAREYGRRSGGASGYADDFIAAMDLSGARTLLDVGSGPGTLAIPLARRLAEVVALDFSAAMLEQLAERAREAGVANIRTLHLAWEDDWREVPVCDIAIASRSTTVDDLDAALTRLESRARLRAYLSYPADAQFIDPSIAEALGIEPPGVPEPTLLLGMLARRGRLPRIGMIETPSRLAGCADFDAFAERVAWSTGEIDAAARERLRRWYDADPERAARGGRPMRWLMLGWATASA